MFAGTVADAYLDSGTSARGYVLLFWRGRHVAELSDLTSLEMQAFTSDLATVCRAIEAQYSPAKLNLLILGNSLPHLHVHIVPRFVDDPDPGKPPRFMLEDRVSSPIDPGDYSGQLEGLRSMLRR